MDRKDKSIHKLPDILGGTAFLTAGIILLMNNFGVIPWSIWSYIIYFWPVIFIFIGLDLISGNSLILKLLTSLVGILIILFILAYSLSASDIKFSNYIFQHAPKLINIFQKIHPVSGINSDQIILRKNLVRGTYFTN